MFRVGEGADGLGQGEALDTRDRMAVATAHEITMRDDDLAMQDADYETRNENVSALCIEPLNSRAKPQLLFSHSASLPLSCQPMLRT